jgi:hypothetical protein
LRDVALVRAMIASIEGFPSWTGGSVTCLDALQDAESSRGSGVITESRRVRHTVYVARNVARHALTYARVSLFRESFPEKLYVSTCPFMFFYCS